MGGRPGHPARIRVGVQEQLPGRRVIWIARLGQIATQVRSLDLVPRAVVAPEPPAFP